MKFIAECSCAVPDISQRVFGRLEPGIGGFYGKLRISQSRLCILERCLPRLEVQVPSCKLLRKLAVGLRKRAELCLEGLEARVCRAILLPKMPLAVAGYL